MAAALLTVIGAAVFPIEIEIRGVYGSSPELEKYWMWNPYNTYWAGPVIGILILAIIVIVLLVLDLKKPRFGLAVAAGVFSLIALLAWIADFSNFIDEDNIRWFEDIGLGLTDAGPSGVWVLLVGTVLMFLFSVVFIVVKAKEKKQAADA